MSKNRERDIEFEKINERIHARVNERINEKERRRERERERKREYIKHERESARATPPPSGGRSMGRRLSRRMSLRLFGVFVSLNIFLCMLAFAGLILHSEIGFYNSVTMLNISSDAAEYIPQVELAEYSRGRVLPRFPAAVFPKETSDSPRYFSIDSNYFNIEHTPFNPYGLRCIYSLDYEYNGLIYRMTVDFSAFFAYFVVAMTILFVWQLIVLIEKSIKNSRLIHRSLGPIYELTRAAETLGRATNVRSPDMSAIKGALESIDVSSLDTRIELGSTQEELQGLAAAINEMLDRIRAAYTAQIRFVSDASHELRTPISVIQGYANLLDRWGKNDEKTLQESIDAIRSEAESMKILVEQLLFLARGDNDTIELELEQMNLAELIGEIAQDTRLIDQTHEFRVEGWEAVVSADRQLIKQAVRIFVDNAVKYTDPGGTITLKSSLNGNRATISVSDTGVGIPDELIPHIFDRFVRADESRTRSSGGAGLGLSIAKWIVARHGGHIEVLSRTGLGTRMSIVLPVDKSANAPTAPIAPVIPNAPTAPAIPRQRPPETVERI